MTVLLEWVNAPLWHLSNYNYVYCHNKTAVAYLRWACVLPKRPGTQAINLHARLRYSNRAVSDSNSNQRSNLGKHVSCK